jgi:hypothetical protein
MIRCSAFSASWTWSKRMVSRITSEKSLWRYNTIVYLSWSLSVCLSVCLSWCLSVCLWRFRGCVLHCRLWVRTYICYYAWVMVCAYIARHVFRFVCICTHAYVYFHIHIRNFVPCVCIYFQVCTSLPCVYTRMHTYLHRNPHTVSYIHAHIQTHMYTYIHTHKIHTYSILRFPASSGSSKSVRSHKAYVRVLPATCIHGWIHDCTCRVLEGSEAPTRSWYAAEMCHACVCMRKFADDVFVWFRNVFTRMYMYMQVCRGWIGMI